MITVGLPNYASPIAWLAMESLCRQITTHEWELIVYEDSDKPLGALFFSGYTERLEQAGCKRVVYEYSKDRVPLNQKWLWMGRQSHPESLGLILQASDCYSEPHRIQTAHKAFEAGYDWVHSDRGYFFNFMTDQLICFCGLTPTGLNLAISKKQLVFMPRYDHLWSGVDFWLFKNLVDPKIFIDSSDNYYKGLDTDGYGRISLDRKKQYMNPEPPFYRAFSIITDHLPMEVIELLDKFEHKF